MTKAKVKKTKYAASLYNHLLCNHYVHPPQRAHAGLIPDFILTKVFANCMHLFDQMSKINTSVREWSTLCIISMSSPTDKC